LDFRVLGPFEVFEHGRSLALGGAGQRALLAVLLLRRGEVVVTERLIDELWGEHPPPTAAKTIQVYVSRLRKVLGAGVLETRHGGYELVVSSGAVDADRFEALITDGRAALAIGDAHGAAALFRQGLGLFRGAPLADFSYEPFARGEIDRLQELRIVACEDQIESELAAGGDGHLVPQLEVLVGSHPLRERLRGLLMVALYRAGRQTDALAVYRQTREMLRNELGLEPGPALRELEHQILNHSPSLGGQGPHLAGSGRALAEPVICPYKGLAFYDRADASHFFGRERLVGDLIARLAESSLVGIIGPSGVGKSSVLRAGVLPQLSAGALPGSAGWQQFVLRPGEHPAAGLRRALGGVAMTELLDRLASGERVVIAVDQLEELFMLAVPNAECEAFLSELVAAADDTERRALVLVALRGDVYGRFSAHPAFAALLSRSHVLVGTMNRGELSQAVIGPASRAGIGVEDVLVEALVSSIDGEVGGLPLLSATLLELWRSGDGRALSYEGYLEGGGVRAAVARQAEAAYGQLDEPSRRVARSVMLRLASDVDGRPTRRRAALTELESLEGAMPVVAALLEARLVTINGSTVELTHEAVLSEWPRYEQWRDEDTVGRRLHAHLASAASEWDAQGRDQGDLYRGARLAAVLDWTPAHGDEVNAVERDFVEASRVRLERDHRRQRRQNQRLRGLLLALAVILLVAVGAAVVARDQQRTAASEASEALARQLGAEAIAEPRLDVAMLMAREGVRIDRSAATESELLTALLRNSAVVGTIALPSNTTGTLVYRPDGDTLAVADGLGELRLYDPRTHRELVPPLGELSDDEPPAYSPDGSLLAYRSDRPCCEGVITVRQARTMQPVASLSVPSLPLTVGEISAGGIAIAPDDRMLYYAYWTVDAAGRPSAAYVQRWTLPAGRPLPSVRIGSDALLAIRLVDGGRKLVMVGSRRVEVLDARSLRVLRTVALNAVGQASTAAVSPDGRTVALGTQKGAVTFVQLASGRARTGVGGGGAGIAWLLYTSGGGRVVSVSASDAVSVWDPRIAAAAEILSGPAVEVAGAALSPDGTTLYTSSLDGLLREWNLAGMGRLNRRVALPAQRPCCASLAPPAPPLALSPDGAEFAVRLGQATVGLFSTQSFAELSTFTVRSGGAPVTALAWSPAGSELAVAGHSGLVQLWRTGRAPRLVRSLAGLGSVFGQPEAVQAVAFSPDGRLLAASDDGKTGTRAGIGQDDDAGLGIWQTATGRLLASPADLTPVHNEPPAGDDLLAYSPDGKLLALSLFDRSILILDGSTGRLIEALSSAAGTTALAFAADGELASGTPAGTVEEWNVRRGREVGSPLVVATSAVTGIAFDAAARLMATSARGAGAVELWFGRAAPDQGVSLATVPRSTASIEFSADGANLVAVGAGDVFTWPVSLSVWEHDACAVAGHELTRSQWAELVTGRRYAPVCP
jgi:DNA-binding SARP family transcriptional activator/WD40 repeat protein